MAPGPSECLGNSTGQNGSVTSEKNDTILTFGRFKLRGKTDDLPQDWWFASTAIPLVAATIGPLANVLSIAALVSKWRVTLPMNGELPEGTDDNGTDIPDPEWIIILNAISLACGFFGNISLLFNFTQRIRYIVALPVTIISWYIATGILIAITVAMNKYVPPVRPGETYSQGFWYAIIAAVLYLIGSMMLMVNMLGYFLGHYPQHFDLDDDQRTLILQTMMFFFWLAGGAAVFQKVCGMSYANALYFCDVTVLTVGFGDVIANNDAGRGLVFPYSVIGIIFLGLMINSIRKFTVGISKDNIIKKHQLNQRERTFSRTRRAAGKGPIARRAKHREKLILLKEEKDRFDAMRDIQAHTNRFKQYYALSMSVLAFGILWCVGALVFMYAEARIQNLSYFDALYFCYVSLLTIGYGDFSPRSNAGKPFFVVWSIVAVPTMTILLSDMSNTVVSAINRGTFTLADWTVMPKEGIWRDFVLRHPKLSNWLENRTQKVEERKRLEEGFQIQDPDEAVGIPSNDQEDSVRALTLEKLAHEDPKVTEHDLARNLALAIKKTANDLRADTKKRYSYEEWVEFTRLIRFSSAERPEEVDEEEEEEGLIEWDWIGEDSPLLADVSESEWILDRLCESLNRYTRKQARDTKRHNLEHEHEHEHEHGRDVTIHSPEDPQLSGSSPKGKKRRRDGHHIETNPAHPEPRNLQPRLRTRSRPHDGAADGDGGLRSPVLRRAPFGDEVVKLESVAANGDRDPRKGSSGGRALTSAVSREDHAAESQ
ncbi:hypothetical protein MBM_02960 [Drepanopeziza brunnea f. sp. 'multigermtubi' MB_m1]|uniref:Potassium channel domain-containing protein n=1 Tax=Marssonina brunnea f. sp. multigermtubi (strain MB_m1) TaxID=1072389 RepID=K1XD42_MARBU|nr:uncharacterized protein MBM_02960 [Drepanopeziza brunnea f. sp. 'multigermtubi' MB_m1]EKD18718.1 hypothetical protein MBM_02960 [Drepanopeziza brunnea f. sp. 'multigermtubi' MB_m1]